MTNWWTRRQLTSRNSATRLKALVRLARSGVESFDIFVAALRDPSTDVREFTAATLGRLADTRAVSPLIGVAEAAQQPPHVRIAAIGALAGLRAPEALVPILNLAAGDNHQRVSAAALDALRELAKAGTISGSSVGFLSDVLSDQSVGVSRPVAAIAHAILTGRLDAWEQLSSLSESPDPRLRCAAARAVGLSGHPRPLEFLLRLVRDNNTSVRHATAEALGRTRDANTIEPLRTLLNDADREIVVIAIKALDDLGPSSQAPEVTQSFRDLALSGRFPGIESLIATVLAKSTDPSATPALSEIREQQAADEDARREMERKRREEESAAQVRHQLCPRCGTNCVIDRSPFSKHVRLFTCPACRFLGVECGSCRLGFMQFVQEREFTVYTRCDRCGWLSTGIDKRWWAHHVGR